MSRNMKKPPFWIDKVHQMIIIEGDSSERDGVGCR